MISLLVSPMMHRTLVVNQQVSVHRCTGNIQYSSTEAKSCI